MSTVRVLVVETNSNDEDGRESGDTDLIRCQGIRNQTGDLSLMSLSSTVSLDTLVATLTALDKNKDNAVAGFSQTTMNNLSLYNALQLINGGGVVGPPTFPIGMARTTASAGYYLWYSGSTSSSDVLPCVVPMACRTLAITFATLNATQIRLRIYKNLNLVTPVYDYSYPASPLLKTGLIDISEGQSGYFTLAAGDLLTFRMDKLGAYPNLSNPVMNLWLQNII